MRESGVVAVDSDLSDEHLSLAAGPLDAQPLISRRSGLEEANEALAAALAREVITGVLIPSRPV